MKRRTDEELADAHKEETVNYNAKYTEWERNNKSKKNKSSAPRLRLTSQEYHCCCSQVSSSLYCRHCKDNEDDDCPACTCTCTAGWWKASQEGAMLRVQQCRLAGLKPGEKPTSSDNVGSFAKALASSIAVSYSFLFSSSHALPQSMLIEWCSRHRTHGSANVHGLNTRRGGSTFSRLRHVC